jgi:hypothetical protein
MRLARSRGGCHEITNPLFTSVTLTFRGGPGLGPGDSKDCRLVLST